MPASECPRRRREGGRTLTFHRDPQVDAQGIDSEGVPEEVVVGEEDGDALAVSCLVCERARSP